MGDPNPHDLAAVHSTAVFFAHFPPFNHSRNKIPFGV